MDEVRLDRANFGRAKTEIEKINGTNGKLNTTIFTVCADNIEAFGRTFNEFRANLAGPAGKRLRAAIGRTFQLENCLERRVFEESRKLTKWFRSVGKLDKTQREQLKLFCMFTHR
jgi:hypothetical protein